MINDYPLKEIADRDVSVKAVKSWAKEARKKLRNEQNLKEQILTTIEGV